MPTTARDDDLYGFPVSFAQRRLWFMDQLFPGTPLYNLPLVLHLTLPVDVGVLDRALGEMARRHESLRTTFRTASGQPVQVVHDEAVVRVTVVPLDHLPRGDREAAAMAFAAADLQRPFDLVQGPLWRATLLRLGRDDHLLLLTAHHIVSDGWSMGLMLRELQALYEAGAAGRQSLLPDLALQYVDYAIWQHEHLTSTLVERQLTYWRDTLADLPTLALPTDRPRPPTASLRGRRHHFAMPARLRRALEGSSQRDGATPFMTLLAAYALLLQRYTGDSDVPIGTPIAGRGRAEFEPLIGFFVNTLVLRVDLDGDPTFRTLLQRVRERALEAYTHQDLPFEKLVEELQPARDLSRNPLFQVMFALQNAPTAGPEASNASLRSVEIETGFTNFDLALDVWRRGDGYAARIEYNVDLFEADTIARLAEHWLALLEGIARDPDQPISSYALEPSRVTHDEAQPQPATATANLDTTVAALIGATAANRPDAVAVVSGDETLTYADLHARATHLSAHLRREGVGPDVPVAIVLDRSPALVVTLLATWYAGGVYVPVDPRDPALRMQEVLADIDPRVIVTTRAYAAHARSVGAAAALDGRDGGATLLQLDALPPEPADTADTVDDAARLPGHLAYVVYTSGSTGRPRGVAVEHRALLNHLRWMQASFPLEPGDRTVQSTSIGFDVSLWELTAPLASGATIVLPPEGAEAEPARLVALLANHAVCALQTTPSFLRLMLDDPALARCTALRWVFCGAESMPRELTQRFAGTGLRASLHNMYGPTESTIDAAAYACPADGDIPDTRSGSVPIGQAIANVRLHVLDGHRRPAPRGLPGELYVAGASLARGYWRQPTVTAERFVPDPLGPPGALMYRTGDRVRALRSGDLEVLGRMDRQVKVRGVRIEPAEVERALTRHPDVHEAHVTVVRRGSGEARLVACAASGDASLTPPDLRRFLTSQLPSPMVPSTLLLVPALPRTSRGKVDVQAIERLDAAATHTPDTPQVAPRTEAEVQLVEIWRSLLDTDALGVTDNFFDLGGHSLLATQVVSRVLDRFAVVVPLRVFFEQPTIEGLAARILDLSATGREPENAPIGPQPDRPASEALAHLSDHEVEQLLRTLVERDAAI